MNGPEHYAEAERLLGEAARMTQTEDEWGPSGVNAALPGPERDRAIAAAQVHATLAVAAVTAQAAFDPEGRALVPQTGIIRAGWETVL